MRTLTKRILSITLALCMCLPMLLTVKLTATAVAYENTHTNTGNQAYDIVAIAQTQVGYQEGTNNDNKYGAAFGHNNVAWCAYFVSWCAKEAGISDSIIHRQGIASPFSGYFNIPNTHGTGDYFPKPGDLVFYGPDSKGNHYHVGIVESVNKSTGYITTIEGNTNSGGSSEGYIVYRHTRHYQHSTICCYGTPNYKTTVPGEHTCNKGTYVFYEAAHPHYKCYECSICGTIWRNTAEPTIVSSCTSCVPEKVSDSGYSSFLPIAAYPISTGHISVYDNTGTEYSNRYIDGATDLCLILDVYTDGWCKVKYPSSVESSGYFVAYVPFSVFASSTSPSAWTCTGNYTTYRRSDLTDTMHTVNNGDSCLVVGTSGGLKQIIHPTPVNGQTCFMMGWVKEPKTHTHSYAGNRVYEIEHPHRISQRCVDYETCGGYIWTDEYYELKTCEQCWHATFNIGASSISVNVGESKTVSASVSGCWPDSAVAYRELSPDNDVVEVTIKNQQATFTGLKAGTTNFSMTVYSDSSKSRVIGTITIPVTVTAQAYTVSYNANGGSGAPSNQTKTHGTALTLSSTVPARFGYNFVGWAKSSSAVKADCQPGESYTSNSDITLYAVWEEAVSLSGYTTADITYPGVGVYYKLTPDRTTSYALLGSGYANLKNANCQITLFNSNGTKIETSSVNTSAGDCSLYYNLNSGSTYYIYVSLTDSTAAGGVDIFVCPGYKVTYHANGGSGAPAADYCYDSAIELSGSKPTRSGYTFLGWAESSAATQATYQPGDRYITRQDITLYAVWEKGCSDNHSYSYKVTKEPTTSATGTLTGTCSNCSGTTTVTLPKLNATDYTYSVTKEPSYTTTGTGRYTWNTTTYGTYYFDVTLDKLTATLTKIEVVTKPTKTVYQIGESLDTTGLSLKASYSDGSTQTITSGFTTSGFDSSSAGEKTVTVTYSGKTASFVITVEESKEVDPNAPKLVVETVTATAGDTVTVAVKIENNPGFGGMAYDINYDNTVIELISYELDLGSGICTDSGMDTYPNKVNLQYAGTDNITGDGVLITLTFKVKDTASTGFTAISVVPEDGTVFGYDGRVEVDFDLKPVNGGIEIIDYIKGDINGDGKVNNRDAARLLQHLAGWSVECVTAAMDVNGDGKVNNRDAARLLQYLAGWNVTIN